MKDELMTLGAGILLVAGIILFFTFIFIGLPLLLGLITVLLWNTFIPASPMPLWAAFLAWLIIALSST
jgi:hypothetical protein